VQESAGSRPAKEVGCFDRGKNLGRRKVQRLPENAITHPGLCERLIKRIIKGYVFNLLHGTLVQDYLPFST